MDTSLPMSFEGSGAWTRLVGLAVVLSLTACSESLSVDDVAITDDAITSADVTPDVTVLPDSSTAPDTALDAESAPDSNGRADVADAPQAPNPCPTVTWPVCSPNGDVGTPTSAAAASTFEGGFLCEDALETSAPCAGEAVCFFGDCVSSVDAIPEGAAIHALLSMTMTGPDCCADVSGDGVIDNAVGKNLEAAWFQAGQGAFDDTIKSSVERGYFVIAIAIEASATPRLWFVHSDPPTAPASYYATFPPPPELVLVARPNAYVPGTLIPRSRVVLSATGPDQWATAAPLDTLIFPLAIVKASLQVRAHGVTVQVQKQGAGYDVRVGGYTLISDFATEFNAYFADDCACWGLEAPFVALSSDSPESVTVNPDLGLTPKGPCTGASFCSDLALLALSGGLSELVVPDLDIDGDGIKDAMSFGFRLTTTPVAALVAPTTR